MSGLSKVTINFTLVKNVCCNALLVYFAYKSIKRIIFNKHYHNFFNKIYKTIQSKCFEEPVPEEIALATEPLIDHLFFDADNVDCRKHVIKRTPCELENCSYYKLKFILDFIAESTQTIDLCMYLITCTDIAEALIEAHRRGIKVRVIVEEEMSTSSESKAQNLIHAGIVVKSKVIPSFMHHKFCITDAEVPYKRRLVTGSLNWTLQGLAGNWENIVIIRHPDIVLRYLEEFNLIWEYFDLKEKKPFTVKIRNYSHRRFFPVEDN